MNFSKYVHTFILIIYTYSTNTHRFNEKMNAIHTYVGICNGDYMWRAWRVRYSKMPGKIQVAPILTHLLRARLHHSHTYTFYTQSVSVIFFLCTNWLTYTRTFSMISYHKIPLNSWSYCVSHLIIINIYFNFYDFYSTTL